MPVIGHDTPRACRPEMSSLRRGALWASRLLAVLMLLVYLPVLAGIGLLILATSAGPPFVKKAYRRRGEDGTMIYLYEFRTECWQTWRETPVGRFLRTTDLYRLPRLANVLTGDLRVGERVVRMKA